MTATAEAIKVSPSVTPFGEADCDARADHQDAAQGVLCCVLAEDHPEDWHLDPVDGPWKVVLRRSEEWLS